MKNRTRLLRIAAVGSSLLLVAVYVSCKANQHDDAVSPDIQPEVTPEATHLPGSKSGEIFPPPARPPQTMGGSKSRAVVTPDDLVIPRVTPGQSPSQTNAPRP